MSSYKNRIPADSVSFSNEAFVFKFEDLTIGDKQKKEEKEAQEKVIFSEAEIRLQEREDELIHKEQELIQQQKEVEELKEKIEREIRVFQEEKEKHWSMLQEEKRVMEEKKKTDYLHMKEFMWDTSIDVAEMLLNQSIAQENFDMNAMIMGMLKRLPITFDKLEVTVHPETVNMMDLNRKDSFILNEIKWLYDYSLNIGDFTIESDKEFFDIKFDDIFKKIKKDIQNKLTEEKVEEN